MIAATNERVLEIDGDPCTMDEFLLANDDFIADDPETVNEIRNMEVGAVVLVGGGAAPLMTVKRVK